MSSLSGSPCRAWGATFRIIGDQFSGDYEEVMRSITPRVRSCVWSEGPGPWLKWPKDATAFCGRVVRVDGEWSNGTSVTVELLFHLRDERTLLCSACARVLAIHPYRCPADSACTGDLTCIGIEPLRGSIVAVQ